MHTRWASYFEQFNFVINHKSEVDNKVPNALSQRVLLLVSLQSKIIRCECLKELYKDRWRLHWNLREVFVMTASTRFSYSRQISSQGRSVMCTKDFIEGELLETCKETTCRVLWERQDYDKSWREILLAPTREGCDYNCEELSGLSRYQRTSTKDGCPLCCFFER